MVVSFKKRLNPVYPIRNSALLRETRILVRTREVHPYLGHVLLAQVSRDLRCEILANLKQCSREDMIIRTLLLVACLGILHGESAAEPEASEVVRAAIDHWRGLTSESVMTMVIHRPEWERSMTMRGWTKGDDRSLVRVLEPKKDRGNGTLTDGDNMWTYSPKVNRVIKIPSSMMSQSWMGSDFSNKDIARADDIVKQYDHSFLNTDEVDGLAVYEIEAVPHEDAAVVWGREVLIIREDHILLEHRFFDQDGELVKALVTLDVGEMGGRTVALRQRMSKTDAPDEWTELQVDSAEYELELKDSLFTQSNLRNPRD